MTVYYRHDIEGIIIDPSTLNTLSCEELLNIYCEPHIYAINRTKPLLSTVARPRRHIINKIMRLIMTVPSSISKGYNGWFIESAIVKNLHGERYILRNPSQQTVSYIYTIGKTTTLCVPENIAMDEGFIKTIKKYCENGTSFLQVNCISYTKGLTSFTHTTLTDKAFTVNISPMSVDELNDVIDKLGFETYPITRS